jgi:hypothetical protein
VHLECPLWAKSGLVRCSKKAPGGASFGCVPTQACGDEARRIAVTSFCGKPKRKDMRALFCAAHLGLNTLVDEFGALVEW